MDGRLAQGEDGARKICKEYFEDLYNIDTQEEVLMGLREITTSGESQQEQVRLR